MVISDNQGTTYFKHWSYKIIILHNNYYTSILTCWWLLLFSLLHFQFSASTDFSKVIVKMFPHRWIPQLNSPSNFYSSTLACRTLLLVHNMPSYFHTLLSYHFGLHFGIVFLTFNSIWLARSLFDFTQHCHNLLCPIFGTH